MKRLIVGAGLLVILVAMSWRVLYPWGLSVEDQLLFDYATANYDRSAMMNQTKSLGLHHGTPVVADHPCSDLCPDYTTRIIHYELRPDQSCAQSGGVEKAFLVPEGVAANHRVFCVPRVLVDYWWLYEN